MCQVSFGMSYFALLTVLRVWGNGLGANQEPPGKEAQGE